MADSNERGGAEVVPLSRFRAALSRPRGYKRVDALLSADDPAAAVAALSVPELYFLVKEVGFADSYELVGLASPEQVRGCLDMDIWDRDRVQVDAVMPWLAAVEDAGFEKVGRVWEELDPELAAYLIVCQARVYDLGLGEAPPEDEDRPTFYTPDTFFAVVFTAESEEDIGLCYRLLEDLYRADGSLARHTLMSARSELPSDLEEMSYRWRSGRLADLGYVEFYEALEVFRPLDPDRVEIGEGTADFAPPPEEGEEARAPGSLPVPVVERLVGRAFLARALETTSDAAQAERLEAALLYLTNKVLSAARVEPGNEEAVRIGTEHAAATLSLGLEHVARGDVDRAREALATVSLTRLHRVGYTLTLRLARYARALAPRALTAGEPSESVLAALLAARPLFARVLDDPPAEGARPFESLLDLRRAAEHLSELAVRIAVADALGVDLLALREVPEPRPALDDYARTALARSLTGGTFDAAPLSADELAAFRAGALAGGRIDEAARDGAEHALLSCLDRAGAQAGRVFLTPLLERWLGELEATFAPLPPDEPVDPRFVEGVILRADKD